MTGEEFQNVQDTVEGEGFHYAFSDYSDFEEITDDKFHELRKAYLKATKELAKYIAVEL